MQAEWHSFEMVKWRVVEGKARESGTGAPMYNVYEKIKFLVAEFTNV